MEHRRCEKVEDYEEWLKSEKIEYKLHSHPKALNMEEMKQNMKPDHAPYIKNLFYKLKKGGFGVLVALDDTNVKKAFWKEINMTHNHVRMGEEKDLMEVLHCYKGCVNPLSLINDHEGKVSVFIMDKKLKDVEYYAFHPGDNSKTIELKRTDFEALMQKIKKTALYLDLEAEETEEAKDAGAAKKGGAKGAEKKPEEDDETKLKMTVEKEKDFAEWYKQLITKAELIEYYDVSGCYILRPNAYFVWEQVQRYLDSRFAELQVTNTYFPMFVTKDRLETEKDHVEGFAPEVAWVTKSGNTDLAQPIAIRPTSETIMYPTFAKWIRSHRDLPLLINQWSNVVRWEFKHPTPFIRTREFLWQEGHTAHATRDEANDFALQILDRYAECYKDIMALPVVKGRKSDNEKFAGGDITYTLEGFSPVNGRSIQACTSHLLGQNFAKMFGIEFQDKDMKKAHAWQTSWGFTTRSIGAFVMIHGDNKGMNFTPKIALHQVVIIPILFKDKIDVTKAKAEEIYSALKKAGIRVQLDDREHYTPGFKINHLEIRGTPIRLELGPKDIEAGEVKLVRRCDGGKKQVKIEGLVASIQAEFLDIHETMYNQAVARFETSKVKASDFKEFMEHLNHKKMILTPWCNDTACEKKVKELSGLLSKQAEEEGDLSGSAKTLCKPLQQDPVPAGTKCFAHEHCGKDASVYCFWGRSY